MNNTHNLGRYNINGLYVLCRTVLMFCLCVIAYAISTTLTTLYTLTSFDFFKGRNFSVYFTQLNVLNLLSQKDIFLLRSIYFFLLNAYSSYIYIYGRCITCVCCLVFFSLDDFQPFDILF